MQNPAIRSSVGGSGVAAQALSGRRRHGCVQVPWWKRTASALNGLAEAPPHYHGHRERLRERFREAGAERCRDYELLELVLFRAMPRRDVKPLAKALIATIRLVRRSDRGARRSGSRRSKGMGEAAITELKIVQAAASRLRAAR